MKVVADFNIRGLVPCDFSLSCNSTRPPLQEFDELAKLEDHLYKNLPPNALVDGHDFGVDEYTIFIRTDEPGSALAGAREILETHHLVIPFCAGYRDFNEEVYIPIWLPSLDSFDLS